MPRELFTDEQVDKAINYVIENGAEDRGKTSSYSLVFTAAGMELPHDLYLSGGWDVVYAFMERFHYRCIERELPPLDALVVNVGGSLQGKPGGGYFKVNGCVNPFDETYRAKPEAIVAAVRFWEEQKQECYEWGIRNRRDRLRNR